MTSIGRMTRLLYLLVTAAWLGARVDAVLTGEGPPFCPVCLIKEIQQQLDELLTKVQTCDGCSRAVYTRYGHTDCGTGATFIYSGVLAGSRSDILNGHNNLCLPSDPTNVDLPDFSSKAIIYGSEYELILAHGNHPKHNHDIPCTVCQTTCRPHSYMQPGTTKCPKGFALDYNGILMSGGVEHEASEFICIDKEMKSLQWARSADDNPGRLLCPVRFKTCESVFYPPYYADMQLSCAVCSK